MGDREDPGGFVEVNVGGMYAYALFAGASAPRHSQRPRSSIGRCEFLTSDGSRRDGLGAVQLCAQGRIAALCARRDPSRIFQWKRGQDRAGARRVSVLLGDRGRRAAWAPSTRTVNKTGDPAGITESTRFSRESAPLPRAAFLMDRRKD